MARRKIKCPNGETMLVLSLKEFTDMIKYTVRRTMQLANDLEEFCNDEDLDYLSRGNR